MELDTRVTGIKGKTEQRTQFWKRFKNKNAAPVRWARYDIFACLRLYADVRHSNGI